METIIAYFENIPPLHRAILLSGGITFFWLLEGLIPLFRFSYKKWKHALPNLFFTATTVLVNFALAFLLVKTADYTAANNLGLLQLFAQMPYWLFVTLGVLLLDFFGAYLAHFVEHKVKPLWMVHLVHHTDHEVDTTTANRHHPLESIIRFIFTMLGAFLLGTPIGVIMLYQSISLLATQFSHANIRLPKKVDNALSWVIVSPDMHKVHHHYKLPYTDSNYGNIFSIWDRLFGTYMQMDTDALVYGVDTFPNADENANIRSLLQRPFHNYRKPTTEN